MEKNRWGLTFGLLAFFLWSIPPVLSLSLIGLADYFQITYYIHISAFLTIAFVSWFFFREYLKHIFQLKFESILLLSFSGISQAACYLCFHYAVQNSSATGATVIHNIWPILLIMLSQIYTESKATINTFQKALITLAFMGAALILLDREISSDSMGSLSPAILFAVASALFAALNSLFYKKAQPSIERDLGSDSLPMGVHVVMLTPRIGVALTLLSVMSLFQPDSIVISSNAFYTIAFMGMVIYAIGHVLFSYSLYNTSLSTLSIASYLTPIFSLFMLTIFMNVNMSSLASVGAALVILSVHQMQNNSKFLNISNAFPLIIAILSTFIVLLNTFFAKESTTLHLITSEHAELVAAIFSILIGFFLARSSELNKQSSQIVISINNILSSLWFKSEKQKEPAHARHIELIAELVLEIDLLPACNEKNKKCDLLLLESKKLNSLNSADKEIKELDKEIKELDNVIRNWIFLEISHLSWPEKASVWILGLLSSITLISNVDGSLHQNIIALIISTVIMILCITMRDLDNDWKSNDILSIKLKTVFFQLRYGKLFLPSSAISSKIIKLPDYIQEYVTREEGTLKHHFLDGISHKNKIFDAALVVLSIFLSFHALSKLT